MPKNIWNLCKTGENILFLFISALLISCGVLYREADNIYGLLAVFGLYLMAVKKAPPLPKTIKYYVSITSIMVLYFALIILFNNWELIFKWRFGTYKLYLFLIFFATTIFYLELDNQKIWKSIIIGSSFTLAWISLIFYSGEFTRGDGYLTDPINRGNMAMFFGLASFIACFAVNSRIWKIFAIIFFSCGVMVSLLSGSRGGWLALPISIFTTILVLSRYRQKRQIKILGLAMALVMLVIFSLWDYLPVANRLHQTIVNVERYFSGDIHSSIGWRFNLWKVSVLAFTEKPIFGWGWSEFNTAHQYFIDLGAVEKTRLFGHPHNQFFLFLSETGILGLLLFLMFLLYPAYIAIKYIKENTYNPKIYFSLLILVATESCIEFMLSDDSLAKEPLAIAYVTIILIGLKGLLNQKNIQSKL